MASMNTEQLEVHCGQALIEHYANNPYQTFHHEPSVAAVVLDAVPDGWAKVDGEWIQIASTEMSAHPLPSGTWGRFHDKNSVHMDGCQPIYVRVW